MAFRPEKTSAPATGQHACQHDICSKSRKRHGTQVGFPMSDVAKLHALSGPWRPFPTGKGLRWARRPGKPIWKWKTKRGYNRRQLAYSEGRGMSDPGTRAGAMQGASPTAQRLESWKEIASYLKRDKRTVQRWEKEYGLPVHRLQLNTGSTVYAYPAELDAWYTERQPPNFPTDADAANALAEDNEIVHELARGESVNVAGNAVGVDEEIPVDVSAEVPPGSNDSVEPQVNSASVTPAAESQTERAGKESQVARRP